MNWKIRVPQVRVVASDGKPLGVLPTNQALKLAEEEGLDLVEVAPQAVPPVCRIMDFGKYKYEQAKKKQEARKHQAVVHLKEIMLRPSTDEHDLQVKLRHIRRFLDEGDKVKVTVRFRGREMAHTDLGKKILDHVTLELGDAVKIDAQPRLEHRVLSLTLAPVAKKK